MRQCNDVRTEGVRVAFPATTGPISFYVCTRAGDTESAERFGMCHVQTMQQVLTPPLRHRWEVSLKMDLLRWGTQIFKGSGMPWSLTRFRRVTVILFDAIWSGTTKGVELPTRRSLHNDYTQQGHYALGPGAAETFWPTYARVHRKMGAMLCPADIHRSPDWWGVVDDTIFQVLLVNDRSHSTVL